MIDCRSALTAYSLLLAYLPLAVCLSAYLLIVYLPTCYLLSALPLSADYLLLSTCYLLLSATLPACRQRTKKRPGPVSTWSALIAAAMLLRLISIYPAPLIAHIQRIANKARFYFYICKFVLRSDK